MTFMNFPQHAPAGFTATDPPLRPLDAAPRPLVLVLEAEPALSDVLVELSGFLRVDVECVPTIGALETALQSQSPIGLLAHVPDGDTVAWTALRTVARNDPGLPVLLITGDRDASGDALDGNAPQHPLTNIYWLDHRPGVRAIAEFLFLAERRASAPALGAGRQRDA